MSERKPSQKDAGVVCRSRRQGCIEAQICGQVQTNLSDQDRREVTRSSVITLTELQLLQEKTTISAALHHSGLLGGYYDQFGSSQITPLFLQAFHRSQKDMGCLPHFTGVKWPLAIFTANLVKNHCTHEKLVNLHIL